MNIPHQRLHNHHLSQTHFTKPAQAVAWMGAVQAQDFAHARYAVGIRCAGIDDVQWHLPIYDCHRGSGGGDVAEDGEEERGNCDVVPVSTVDRQGRCGGTCGRGTIQLLPKSPCYLGVAQQTNKAHLRHNLP